MLLCCMKEKTPLMAHKSSAESDDQIPCQPLELKKKPHQPKDNKNMEQQQEDDSDKEDTHHRQTPSASKTHFCNNMEIALQELVLPHVLDVAEGTVVEPEAMAEDSGRERLKRHRVEVAGRVWIPDLWGQENLLKDWIDCSAFDAPLNSSRIMTARASLVEEGRRTTTGGFRFEFGC
ncbi:protein BIC2-like [Gastrolobium bilobum]|uniref:protein BIC2-like n=1 Tax=Gastrolobium bilobum TaxID=150636 RepID=UPI002AAF4487|nr:protein BIC2-like [Gastrolobium bilobum]